MVFVSYTDAALNVYLVIISIIDVIINYPECYSDPLNNLYSKYLPACEFFSMTLIYLISDNINLLSYKHFKYFYPVPIFTRTVPLCVLFYLHFSVFAKKLIIKNKTKNCGYT